MCSPSTRGYTQGAGGTLAIELDGTAAGQFDQLAVAGDVTLGGTVALQPGAAFDGGPIVGAAVGFLDYDGSRTGTFATTTVTPPLSAGKTVAPGYDDPGTRVTAVVSGPDADGDGLADGQDGCPAQAATTANGCPEAQQPGPGPGPGPGPVPPLPIPGPPDADGDGLPDATDGCPTVAASTADGCPAPPDLCAAASRVRNKTKLVPGGALVMRVAQTNDPVSPLRLDVSSRRVAVGSVVFTVNGTALQSSVIPASLLRAGRRNVARAVVTLANGRRTTITQVLRLARCTQATIRCTRVSGGAQLRCTSTLPRRARRVRVTITGAVGQRAVGSTRVRRPRRGARNAAYTVTLPATVPFAPGTYTYRHTVTTTRRGERLVVVRSFVLT